MAKKGGGGDDWLKALAWIVGGGLVLWGVKVATDEDKSGRIDLIVAKLNENFGKQWVTFGLGILRAYLEKTLPKPVVALVEVVYQVEQRSLYTPMSGPQKKQAALRILQG